MESRIQFVAIGGAAILLLIVFELVRRRRLMERYALLWLFSAFVLLLLGAVRPALEGLASAIGIYYPPSALFFIAFGFVLALLLHFSLAVSRLADQTKVLAQRLSQLEERQNRDQRADLGSSATSERKTGSRFTSNSTTELSSRH